MLDFSLNKYYTINDLVNIMQILRSDEGCPWDKEQNHHSIRNNFIEEVYEAVEAIDTDNPELLKEELGDVLLQVIFHAQIENEKDVFSFDDVVNGICQKLIIRHPHVFGEVSADSSDEVLKNWEAIKNKTKGTESYTQTLTDVPMVLPALIRAQKVGQRASRAGMDFTDVSGALSALKNEIQELEDAISSDRSDEVFSELGDVLFSCANVARKLGFSPEEALTKSTEKFISRFRFVEEQTKKDGFDMKQLSIEELDVYWANAKK